jgi:hypothetical protein
MQSNNELSYELVHEELSTNYTNGEALTEGN